MFRQKISVDFNGWMDDMINRRLNRDALKVR